MSELRHRISILRPVTDTDDEGNILTQTTQEIAKAWALVLPFAAKISNGYAEKVQEVDYRIVIRYRNPRMLATEIRPTVFQVARKEAT